MEEYEVDVFPCCEKPDCEHTADEMITVNGFNIEGDIHEWECPGCKTKYEFSIEYQPEIVGFTEKED